MKKLAVLLIFVSALVVPGAAAAKSVTKIAQPGLTGPWQCSSANFVALFNPPLTDTPTTQLSTVTITGTYSKCTENPTLSTHGIAYGFTGTVPLDCAGLSARRSIGPALAQGVFKWEPGSSIAESTAITFPKGIVTNAGAGSPLVFSWTGANEGMIGAGSLAGPVFMKLKTVETFGEIDAECMGPNPPGIDALAFVGSDS